MELCGGNGAAVRSHSVQLNPNDRLKLDPIP